MYAAAQIHTGGPSRDRVRPPRRRPGSGWRLAGGRLLLGTGVVALLGCGLARVALGEPATVYAEVTVEPGDTLWGIAAQHYPGADTRAKVDEIMRANGLHDAGLKAGEELRLPLD